MTGMIDIKFKNQQEKRREEEREREREKMRGSWNKPKSNNLRTEFK